VSWMNKMNDVKKSALWALISIPISFFGFLISWGLIHNGGIMLIPFAPGFLTMLIMSDGTDFPEWLVWFFALIAQYLSYFIVILILIKTFKVLKATRAENIAKEQSEKDHSIP